MGLWGQIFAATYDRMSAGAERAGLGAERDALLSEASGRILEIGAGTGVNVDHYPAGADVVYTEPDPHMAKRLRARGIQVVEAGADALPFADGSFDTVVSTLVLCTVPDVPSALREMHRVLAPGGRLLFLEHVRGEPGSKLARRQDRFHRPWKAIGRGLQPEPRPAGGDRTRVPRRAGAGRGVALPGAALAARRRRLG